MSLVLSGCDSQGDEVDVSGLVGRPLTVFGNGVDPFEAGSTWLFGPSGALVKYVSHEAPVCGGWVVDGPDLLVAAEGVYEVGVERVLPDSVRLNVTDRRVLLVTGEHPNDLFAQESAEAPASFTQTSEEGEVLKTDFVDWRVAPGLNCRVAVQPAFPNPAEASSAVTIVVTPQAGAVTGSLRAAYRTGPGSFSILDEAQAETNGTYRLTFTPGAQDLSGLERILVLDAQSNVVSYGDLFVSGGSGD